jgi:hypothetical protein
MDPSKIAEARKEGYSDKEIADFLASSNTKIGAARAEGYSDKEILDHLSPPRSLGRRALDTAADVAGTVAEGVNTGVNYLGTQAVKAASGLAGMPRAAGDAMNFISEKTGAPVASFGPPALLALAGKHLPSGDEISKSFFGATGAPEVSLPGPVGKEIDAGVQGLLTVPMTGGAGLPAYLAGALGGAASEVGGQLTEGTPYEIPARVGGAILGGGVGAGAGAVANKAGQVAKAAVAPFTESGRQNITARALRDAASNPDDAIAAMERYTIGREAFPDAVPGFKVNAGQASRDPGLMAVSETVPQSVRGYVAQSNNSEVVAALDRIGNGLDPKKMVAEIAKLDTGAAMRAQAALDALPAGVDAGTAGRAIQDALRGRYEALDAARSTAVNPLYEAARADTTRLKPWPLQVSTADAAAANKGDLKTAAQKVRSLLYDANGKVDRTPAGMMATRDALTDMIGSAEPGSKMQRMLMGFKDEVDNALAVVPPEKQARDTFAQMSRPLDVYRADKGYPFNANVIEKDRYGTNFMVPQERVPAMYFRPGDAGAATMKEFLGAQPTPQAIDAMRSFIADKARNAPDVKKFLQQNQQAIETLDPSLVRQLESAAATKSISEGFRASPAGQFINNDLDAAVKQALGARDSGKRLQELRMTVGGNPEAVGGLQRAIIDDFRQSASAPVASDAAGNPMVTSAGANRWLKSNRASVMNVLTTDQVKALDDIARNLENAAQPVPGRTGSPTFDRLATESILGALVSPRYADAAPLYAVRKALNLAYGGANEKVLDAVYAAIQDPKVATALMKKATPGNVKMIEPMLVSITRGAAVPATKGEQ